MPETAGPWEKYAGADTSSGPWEKYASGPPGIAKPPIPQALQGPPPAPQTVLERAWHNLPGSFMDAAARSASFGPPAGSGNTRFADTEENPIIKGAKDAFSSLVRPFTSPKESFADDPVGTVASYTMPLQGGKALAETPGGQMAGAAAKGAAKGAAGGVRPLLNNFNITKPLKTLPDLYDSGKEIYQGAKKGLASERTSQIPRTSFAVEPNPLPPPPGMVEPIPGSLPSGRVPGSIANQTPMSVKPPAAPVATGPSPELLDQIAMGMGGRKFAKLDPAGQASVRTMAERVQNSGVAAAPTVIPPPGSELPEAPASALPPPRDFTGYRGKYKIDPEDYAHSRRAQKTVKWAEYLNNKGISVEDASKLDWAKHAADAGLNVPQSSASVNQILVLLHDLKGGLKPPPQ